jgi:hypothetical protein
MKERLRRKIPPPFGEQIFNPNSEVEESCSCSSSSSSSRIRMFYNPANGTKKLQDKWVCRATLFRGNGAGSAAHYFVGTGAWGTG